MTNVRRSKESILAVLAVLAGCGGRQVATVPASSPAPATATAVEAVTLAPVVLLAEDFDGTWDDGLAGALLDDHHITLVEGFGRGGSDGISVAYVGFERGSERVGRKYPLEETTDRAVLSFDVCFDEEFQWTHGGKLHGLAPKYPVTGGGKRRAKGWSARMLFKEAGRVAAYLYDQDETAKWGIGRATRYPVFEAGQWHHVVLQVRLNSPGEADGFALIRIDDREVMRTENVAFRGEDGPETRIQNFLFSTFHGGNGPKWTPVRNGKPTTVYAYFDNFLVTGDSTGRP